MIDNSQNHNLAKHPKFDSDNFAMQQAFDNLTTIQNGIDFSHAAQLAQFGNLKSAEAVLRNMSNESPSHKVWDMLARVCAQQGKLEDARKCWEEALQFEEGCKACQAGIERIHEIQKRAAGSYGWISVFRRAFFLLLILVFVAAAFVLINNSLQGLYELSYQNAKDMGGIQSGSVEVVNLFKTQQTMLNNMDETLDNVAGLPQINAEDSPNTVNQEEILNYLEDNQMGFTQVIDSLAVLQTQQAANPIQSTPTPLSFSFQDEAITVMPDGSGNSKIVFKQGLFQYETFFSDSGQKLLREIGYQLEPLVNKVDIRVIGFTDDIEQENDYLSLKRALAVVTFFDRYTQLPKTMFTIEDPGEIPAPYSNNSWENRSNNRTVILIITPKE